MRFRYSRGCLCLVAFFTICAARYGTGEVIDRIVAVVDKRIITLSDIRAERAIREVLGEPVPAGDKELLDEVIDQQLIRTQLQQYPYAEPSDNQVTTAMQEIKELKGLPADKVRAAVRDRLRIQRFFADQFGQLITTTDAEVQKYYEDVFVPVARERGLNPVPPLSSIIEDIRQNVLQEKLAVEVKKWLEQGRRAARIEILN
jgi:parvulin-like peptidyl-prolyl isomerase